MPLLALVLTFPAFAEDRSDAERADARSDDGRADARGSDAERVDPRAARAHRSSGARAATSRAGWRGAPHHVRAHGPRTVVHRVYRPAPRVVVVGRTASPPPERARTRAASPPKHDVSVTVNVADLPAPLLSASAEVALGRKVGVLGTGGIGYSDAGALYELGGDVRLYALGDFDVGVFVGAGAGLTNLSPLAMNDPGVTVDGFVGGKFTAPFGLTADLTVGLEGAAHEEIGGIYPTVKIGVGWSF